MDGLGVGEFHEVGVDVPRVEVPEECQDDGVNLDILSEDVGQSQTRSEKRVHSLLCDFGREVVETVDSCSVNELVGVPIRGYPDCGGF